eukprot:6210648-Pleurochrysis_carterae.AAC.1
MIVVRFLKRLIVQTYLWCTLSLVRITAFAVAVLCGSLQRASSRAHRRLAARTATARGRAAALVFRNTATNCHELFQPQLLAIARVQKPVIHV